MRDLQVSSSNAQISKPRLGASHGYRLDGDMATLNAEIDWSQDDGAGAGLALQLWACDEPYQGGSPLSGVKVAETTVAAPAEERHFQYDSVSFARPPALARDYAMVMVLAADRGSVLDFANYPQRQRFVAPHLEGAAAYELHDDGSVTLKATRVVNPRASDNLSGSLALQLWAMAEPYRGGELRGTLLASAEVGQLSGQTSVEVQDRRCGLTAPRRATPHLALVLCEWTAQGYVARDGRSLVELYVGPWSDPAPAQSSTPTAGEPVPAPQPSAQLESKVARPAVVSVPKEARASLNAASEGEIAAAMGFSKKLAAEIVKAKPVTRFEQLLKIRGVGEKTIEKMRGVFRL